MTFRGWVMALVAAAAAVCAGPPAGAQVTGQMVNPDVMLVLDTSRSMDWLRDTDGVDTAASERERLARKMCDSDANDLDGTSLRTSWQQLLDVMLGSVPPSNFHCFLEEPSIRPALRSGTVSTEVSNNTNEYTTSPSSHFRAVSCYDPRTITSRGDWNTTTGQCVGQTPDPTEYQMVDNNTHWCRKADVHNETYVDSLTGKTRTRQICYDYNPLAKPRSSNGILERYRTLARFGVMTYDNKPSPLSDYDGTITPAVPSDDAHTGWFDYGASRKWNCKRWSGLEEEPGAGCTWNAGARATHTNAVGGLVPISEDLELSNQQVRDVLDTTEPLYCSPVGALLDDVGYYFNADVGVKPAAAGGGGSDLFYACRPKLVIFIGDGAPNQDFEFPQDYCGLTSTYQDANGYWVPQAPNAASKPSYTCPWNSSNQEVLELRTLMEGMESLFSGGLDVDPVYFVAIGFNAGKKGDVVCTPTWTGTCAPPTDARCVQIAEDLSTEAKCKAAFLTPRQFLNELALTGWPETGYAVQPPWRDGTSTICTDMDDPLTPTVDHTCGGEVGDAKGDGAIFVDGPEELSAVLDLILSTVTAATATRTEVVTTNQVNTDYDGDWESFSESNLDESSSAVAQYEFNSGFEVRGGQPWRGYLYRQGYACSDSEDDSGPKEGGTSSLHTWLDAQTTRRIYSITDANLGSLAYGTVASFREGFDGKLEEIGGTSSSINDCDVGGPTADDVCQTMTTKPIVAALRKHLYGESGSSRADHRLADIYNSTPALLGPPLERINVSSYQGFQTKAYTLADGTTVKQQSERPPILYTGTNDSVLHAFDVWATSTSAEVENWGYVPNALLGDLTKQFPISWTVETDTDGAAVSYTVEESGLYQHMFGVDGSPVAADVRLYRTNTVDDDDYWRSVVIGGLGKGGAGYYALDVTGRQGKPNFRWEITNSRKGYADAKSAWPAGNLFGLTLARPALTYVYVDAGQTADIPGSTSLTGQIELAVAILPGGYKSDESGGPGTSTGVAIVRAADGALIRYLDPSNTDDLCDATKAKSYPATYLAAQLVGEPAVPYPLRSLTVNDEAFIGDDRGRLWRIDMSSRLPNGSATEKKWCLDLFFDSLLTTHFPYQDCIAGTECCNEKAADPSIACSEGTIAALASDGDWSIDSCTGRACTGSMATYPFPRIPVSNAPTIVQDENRNNIILFGTGQLDGVEALDHHRVFSLTQSISYQIAGTYAGNNLTASTQASAPTINWWLGEPIPSGVAVPAHLTAEHTALTTSRIPLTETATAYSTASLFNTGEKMLGRITVFNQVAYFTTFIPVDLGDSSVNACNSGGSRIWGVNFGPRNGATWTKEEFGKLDTSGKMFQEYVNSLLSGAKVVRRPSCNGQADFQVVTQRANPVASSSPAPYTGTEPRVLPVALSLAQPTRGFTTVSIDSWSLVFD